jgi:hypothetical protein
MAYTPLRRVVVVNETFHATLFPAGTMEENPINYPGDKFGHGK